jgi:hypothetical protein
LQIAKHFNFHKTIKIGNATNMFGLVWTFITSLLWWYWYYGTLLLLCIIHLWLRWESIHQQQKPVCLHGLWCVVYAMFILCNIYYLLPWRNLHIDWCVRWTHGTSSSCRTRLRRCTPCRGSDGRRRWRGSRLDDFHGTSYAWLVWSGAEGQYHWSNKDKQRKINWKCANC